MTVATGFACTACGGGTVSPEDGIIDNGWALPYELFGYYGGFTDDIQLLMDSRQSRRWFLCHDCIVKLFNLFPRLAETINAGQHSCSDATPCCKFAWRLTETGIVQYPVLGQWEDKPHTN